jgi:hypothetical protein
LAQQPAAGPVENGVLQAMVSIVLYAKNKRGQLAGTDLQRIHGRLEGGIAGLQSAAGFAAASRCHSTGLRWAAGGGLRLSGTRRPSAQKGPAAVE